MTPATVRGLVDRRILINYRVRPEVLARILPAPFRPQIRNGWGIAGICLIRFRAMRPFFLPAWCGLSSENAAHRFAVEWDDAGKTRTGVYIPHRETSSRLNALFGGRLFAGRMNLASFDSRESNGEHRICVTDGNTDPLVTVNARESGEFPATSLFDSLDAASEFFRVGSCGYSDSRRTGQFDGVELHTAAWCTSLLEITSLSSRYFDDNTIFPKGTIAFDNALLLRNVPHEWRSRGRLSSIPQS